MKENQHREAVHRQAKIETSRKQREDNWSHCVSKMREGYERWVQVERSAPASHGQQAPSAPVAELGEHDFDIQVYGMFEGSSTVHFRDRAQDSESGVTSLVARGYIPTTPVILSTAVSIDTLEMLHWVTRKDPMILLKDFTRILCELHAVSLINNASTSRISLPSLRSISVQRSSQACTRGMLHSSGCYRLSTVKTPLPEIRRDYRQLPTSMRSAMFCKIGRPDTRGTCRMSPGCLWSLIQATQGQSGRQSFGGRDRGHPRLHLTVKAQRHRLAWQEECPIVTSLMTSFKPVA